MTTSNRLITTRATHRRGALPTVLDHLADSHPDEHATALAMLQDTHTWGHTEIADALTAIAREDNLGVRVTEKSIREYRRNQKAHGNE